ncbi:hypothetical protein [Piscinibacter terrae]|uniref:BIG2 domain-containing protein n=1 Tax=Piscinibacter terrae TaxID=2496871 RepID=A0A3N7HMS6_9BURK|nr:hypothetical protein [Albitalea terrae]RQP22376.1 hypothetical protein DZC73_22230 [Albitalea terrae]
MHALRLLFGFLLAMCLSACGGGGDAAPSPAFTITGMVDGIRVAGLSVTPGQTAPLVAQSGHQVRLDSTATMTWSAVSSSASVGVIVDNGATWLSSVTTSSGGTVTLTATLVADTSKTATVVIAVQP